MKNDAWGKNGGGVEDGLQSSTKELLREVEMFFILIGMAVTWVFIFVKYQQSIYCILKHVNFLYVN